jgi:hypothetical protein
MEAFVDKVLDWYRVNVFLSNRQGDAYTRVMVTCSSQSGEETRIPFEPMQLTPALNVEEYKACVATIIQAMTEAWASLYEPF